MLSWDTAYSSFGGEVEASTPPTIGRLPDSRRHQVSAIAPSAVPTTSDAIEEMLEQSQSLWGLSLPYFIWNYGDSALNLREKSRNPGEAQRNPGRSRIALLSIRTTGCAKTENC